MFNIVWMSEFISLVSDDWDRKPYFKNSSGLEQQRQNYFIYKTNTHKQSLIQHESTTNLDVSFKTCFIQDDKYLNCSHNLLPSCTKNFVFYFFLYVYKLLGIIYFHSIFLNLAISTYIQNRFLKIKFLLNLVIYIVVTKKFLSSRKERWQGTIDVLNEWRKYLIRNVFLITYKIDMKKMWQSKRQL